jgi:hypothetical protein
MFKSGFKEATENSANFPEDTPSTFDIHLEWLYTGSLRQLNQSRNHTAAGPTFVSDWAPQQVYALADKLCLSDLCDRVMDNLLDADQKANILPGLAAMKRRYSDSPEGSTMRKYAAYSFYYIMMEYREETDVEKWSNIELGKLLVSADGLAHDYLALAREKGSAVGKVPRPTQLPRCYFHQHAESKPCHIRKAPVAEANKI